MLSPCQRYPLCGCMVKLYMRPAVTVCKLHNCYYFIFFRCLVELPDDLGSSQSKYFISIKLIT